MTAVRILLADDHGPTRADVRAILEADGRFVVVAEAADASGAIAAATSERPDVSLLDINMPGTGIAAAWEISSRLPESKIVMLTVSREDQDLFAALRAGAVGYLLKDMDGSRLPDALADVIEGKAALPPELVTRILGEFRDRSPRRRAPIVEGRYAELTSREWQVLELLRQELTTAEIARRLTLSPVTVRTHLGSILRKVRAPNRGALLEDLGDR